MRRALTQTDVTALAFAADNQTLAAGSKHCVVQLWNAVNGAEVHPAIGHVAAMGAVAIAPDGRHVATSAYDRTVQVWEAATGKRLHRFDIDSWAHSLLFTADGTGIVCAGRDGVAPTWTGLHDGKAIRTFAGSGNQHLHMLANSADGKKLLGYARGNDTLYVWDYATGRLEDKITKNVAFRMRALRLDLQPKPPAWTAAPPSLLDVCPDGRSVAVIEAVPGKHEFTLGLRDLRSGQALCRLDPAPTFWGASPSYEPRFAPDGRILVCVNVPVSMAEAIAYRDLGLPIHIYETATGKLRREYRGHASGVVGLDFSADGRFLVTAGTEEAALVWDLHGPDQSATDPMSERMNILWDRMAHAEARALPAILGAWAAGGSATIEFFRKRLKPATLTEAPRIARWVAELDDEAFECVRPLPASWRALAKLSSRGFVEASSIRRRWKPSGGWRPCWNSCCAKRRHRDRKSCDRFALWRCSNGSTRPKHDR